MRSIKMIKRFPNWEEHINTICLIGSSKFKTKFEELGYELEMSGYLVLSMAFYQHTDNKLVSSERREILKAVDQKRINLANKIIVINIKDYIGEDTIEELKYARQMNKEIKWIEYPSKYSQEDETVWEN